MLRRALNFIGKIRHDVASVSAFMNVVAVSRALYYIVSCEARSVRIYSTQ